MSTPKTPAALHRKIERLEAQLKALTDCMDRDRQAEYQTIRRAADMAVRIEQATRILTGSDE